MSKAGTSPILLQTRAFVKGTYIVITSIYISNTTYIFGQEAG